MGSAFPKKLLWCPELGSRGVISFRFSRQRVQEHGNSKHHARKEQIALNAAAEEGHPAA